MTSMGRIATLGLTALFSAPLFSSFALAQECPVRSAAVQAGLEKILATTSESELADMRIQQMTASLEKKIGTLRSDSLQSGYQTYYLDILIKDNRRELQVVRDNMEEASALASEIATNLLKSGLREAYETPTKALACQPWRVSEIWLQFECRQKNDFAASVLAKNAAWTIEKKQLASNCLAQWNADDINEVARLENEARLARLENERVEKERSEALAREAARVAQETSEHRAFAMSAIQNAESIRAKIKATELEYERCKTNWRYFDRESISDASIAKVASAQVYLAFTQQDPKRELCTHMLAAADERIKIMKDQVGNDELLRDHFSTNFTSNPTVDSKLGSYLSACVADVTSCKSGASATIGGRLWEATKAKAREFRAKRNHRQIQHGEVGGN